jgi:hypothetical protein
MVGEQRLTVQLLYSLHGAPEDFQDILRDSKNALPEAGVVAVEMDWQSTFDKNGSTSLSSVEYILATYPYRLNFQEEQISWLEKRNKIILPCEYPDNFDSKLLQSLKELLKLCQQAEDNGDQRKYIALWGSYQTTRQWLFIAQIGYWLRQLEDQGKLLKEPIKVPFMVGIHRALALKINDYFAIPIEIYNVTNYTIQGPDYNSYLEIFESMTTHARVTHKQIKKYLSLN